MSHTIQYPVLSIALLALLAACSDSTDPAVTPRPVASVAVTPATSGIVVGQTVALTAVAKNDRGEVVVGRSVQWTSSNAVVATVSSSGIVTAIAEGAATVSATVDGKTGRAEITVSRVPVASVRLTPSTVVLEPVGIRQLTAVAFDAAGNVLEGRQVQWSTDAPGVATVTATGLVQAVARGYAVITATVEGRFGSTAVTVTEPDPAQQFDLVYERRPFNGGGEIRRVSLASGQSVPLPLALTIEGTFVRDVTPSPDGTRVAFTVAWYPQGWSTLDGDIYVANVDGSALRRLTTAPELDDQPAWSPDGRRIVFRSRRAGDWDIWIMNADGSGQMNLMDNQLPARGTEQTPAWSPDGARIVYASDIDSFSYAKLWTMRPDGSDKRRLLPSTTGTFEIDQEPSWSPGGTSVAFRRIASNGAGSDIMIAIVATGAVTRIAMDGVQAMPAWSPDGTLLAFTSNHEGLLSHVYTMKPNGSSVVRYTTGVDENTYPRWLRTTVPAGQVGSK
jgi:tricorn protease-like protein